MFEVAIAKAKTAGLGYVGVKNSTHFGAAGYYAFMAAREEALKRGISFPLDVIDNLIALAQELNINQDQLWSE